MSPESTGLPSPGWACALAPYTFPAAGRGPGGRGGPSMPVMARGATRPNAGRGCGPRRSFTAGAFAGAGVALGLNVYTVNDAIRAGVALAIGALLGFAAERAAAMVGGRRA